MASLAISARWRWFALVFGVLVPGLVWGELAAAAAPNTLPMNVRDAWQFAVVALEIVALLTWSFLRRRTPALELVFAALFAGGALFAGYYCVLALAGLAVMSTNVHASDVGWLLTVLMILSPFPCLVAYAGSASIALENWHMLPRTTPVRGAE
jgi:hypothetical protein